MTKAEQATSIMEQMANDNKYGYLWGGWGPYDYDCGHAVITAWEKAGVPLKTHGATYTGNMKSAALSCGFRDVTAQCNLSNGSGMVRGDILLNIANHVAVYCGNGKMVHFRSSEGNSLTGDQNGQEARIQNYSNYPWDCILRFQESSTEQTVQKTEEKCSVPLAVLKRGSTCFPVKMMQYALIQKGFSVGPDKDDGDFGANTETALKRYQTSEHLTADGICGEKTWISLFS